MSNLPKISATAASERVISGALLIDVRSPQEFATDHLPAAQNIPLAELPRQIRSVARPTQEILLYCSNGHRSRSAALVLQKMGYRNLAIVQ